MKTTIFAPQPLASFADPDEPRFWIDDTSGQILDSYPRGQRCYVELNASAYSPAASVAQLRFRFAPRHRYGCFVTGGRAVCTCSKMGRETHLLARGGEP
jgi:hypothetical protein